MVLDNLYDYNRGGINCHLRHHDQHRGYRASPERRAGCRDGAEFTGTAT